MPDYAPGTVRGLLLVPDDAAAVPLVALSHGLAETHRSLVVLGMPAPRPHVSLLHCHCDEALARRLWTTLTPVLPPTVEVGAHSYYVRPDGDRLWVGLTVRPTSALHELHLTCRAAAADLGVALRSSHGGEYWPHLTLALWDRHSPVTLPLLKSEPVILETHPVLMGMGPHGTAETQLEPAP